MCHASEKLVQLTRIILYETQQYQATRLILYFATGASVDYFYKVRIFFSLHLTYFPTLSTADFTTVFARNRSAILTSRTSSSFCADADIEFVREF
jgi:ATP-dependent RNA helicase DDX55/SPB4